MLVVWFVHAFLLYSLLALGDLLHHVWRIESAVRAGDLASARRAVSALVGRDTDRMDGGACRRAAVESLSENLTDGFVSPVFWYVLAGLPGLVFFKVVSTMDSMVGNKTPRYSRFGWCGARLDDVMNYLPARITWLVIAALALAAARATRAGKRGPSAFDNTSCCWVRIRVGAKLLWPAHSSDKSSDRSGSGACKSPISGSAPPPIRPSKAPGTFGAR